MISSILFFLFLFSSIFLFPFPLVLFVCLSFRRSVTAVWEIEHDSRSRPRFQITVSLEFNKPVASIEKWATWCYQDDLNRSDTLSYRSMFFLCLYTHDHSFFYRFSTGIKVTDAIFSKKIDLPFLSLFLFLFLEK